MQLYHLCTTVLVLLVWGAEGMRAGLSRPTDTSMGNATNITQPTLIPSMVPGRPQLDAVNVSDSSTVGQPTLQQSTNSTGVPAEQNATLAKSQGKHEVKKVGLMYCIHPSSKQE